MLRGFFSNTLYRIVTTLVLLAGSSLIHAEYKSLEKIIAIVEDTVILQSELDEKIKLVRNDIIQNGRMMPPDEILYEQILEQLILESIQMQLAEKNGIRVSDSTLSDTMNKIAQQNGKNLDEFKLMVEADGMDYGELRKEIRKNLILSRLRQKLITNRINITEQDVKNYLNSKEGKEKLSASYRLDHVLVDNKANAEALLKKLKDGADFKSTASQFGRYTDLGLRKIEQLPTLFVEPAQKLQLNEISEPIASASGYHLIKLVDKQGGDYKMVSQTKVRHILIKPNEIRSKSDAEHLINDIRAQIIEGEDFAEFAKTYSEDPVSASDGGELGWSNPGDYVPEFESTMNALAIGVVSTPFYSTFGWHILEVMERREHNVGKEFQLNEARGILQQRQFEDELQLWLREVRQDAFVEIKGKS